MTVDQPQAGVVDRYPRRRRRPRVIGIVVLCLVAAVGLSWLLWAAWEQSRPAVSGEVRLWHIDSDSRVTFTVTVDRPDPSVPASCRVIAQAQNFETVGEKTLAVDATRASLVDVSDSMRTLRRATSISVSSCWRSTG